MPRFKPNDAVFILPKYADPYPDHSAVVTSVTADPIRPFNEYTLEFAAVLDAVFDRSLEEIVQALPLAKNIVDALLHHQGQFGSILRCVLA
jgi:c-di-GMP-related signal transduction protein